MTAPDATRDWFAWPDPGDLLGKLRRTEADLHRAHVAIDELREALEVECQRGEGKAGWIPCRVVRRIVGLSVAVGRAVLG